MKSILIAINVMLAILAAGEVIKCLSLKNDIASARETTTLKKTKETSRPIVSTPVKASPITHAIQRSPQQIEEQVNLISALNIFSSERTPDIPTAAKRTAANNASAEKKLVGTFEMNGVKGAIILQRTNQRNGNRNNFGFDGGFGMGGFGFGGMGFGMDMGMNAATQNNNTSQASAEEVSQAQIEDARQRLAQLQSVMQTLQRNNATADQLASITRQIEAQNTLLQQLLAIATPQDAEEDGVASISATNSNNVRQYLRLGDSTSDGYMLIDVTRTTATLRRNNDVIELTMQKASDNQEAMAFAASRASAAQVVVSDTPANTSSSPAPANNNRGRRDNGGFGGDFGGFGGGDFGGFGGGDFGGFGEGGGGFGGFGGDDGGFGGFGGGNGGFGGGNNGFGGGNGGFGGGNNNSRTNSMTGGNRAGMNSNSRTTTTSASSRNTTNRTGMNNNSAGRTNTTTRSNANTGRTNTTTNAGRTNSNASRNNAAGRTGVNTGNRTGGAGMGGR
jgi:hypothetical protein